MSGNRRPPKKRREAGGTPGEPAGTPAGKVPPRGSVPPRGGRSGAGGANRANPRSRQASWQARRRRNLLLAGAAVVVVVVLVVVLIVVKATGGTTASKTTTSDLRQPAPAAAVAKITSVPLATLVAAAPRASGLTAPQAVNETPLTAQGKPELLYIGAEFCPICATERWAMTIALSHFGTFTNLQQTHSAVNDGDIPTLSYYGSTYTSPYLTFTPVENTTNQIVGNRYQLLQTPTPAQTALWDAHSNPPNAQGESYPFIYAGGKWILQTSQFSAATLEGSTFDQIVNDIGSNNTTIGVDIDASALVLTQQLCKLTGQQPTATCSAVGAASTGQ